MVSYSRIHRSLSHFGWMFIVSGVILANLLSASPQDPGEDPAAAKKSTESSETKETVDPSGTWWFEIELRGRKFKDSYKLSLDKDGKVVGKVYRNDRIWEVEDGKVEGNELSFTVTGNFRDLEVTSKFNGKINGDEITGQGTVSAGDRLREFPWNAKRSVDMNDVVGTWNIRIPRNSGNAFTPSLVISKDGDNYKGQYTSSDGTIQEVTDLGVKDNQLTFTAVITRAGNEITMVYTGRPYGPNIKEGTLDLNGGAAEVAFTATLTEQKKKGSKEAEKEKAKPEADESETDKSVTGKSDEESSNKK